jgi:PHD/YefM family antitoxin component YafN of YafNO toxin-antitoxin module
MSIKINNNILKYTEKLISISDFSKGKTSKIFDDVKNNHTEYIVLKNNQPTALVISLDNYRELVDKASKLEILLDKIEEARLAGVADDRTEKGSNSTDFDDVLSEFGFSHDEIFSNLNSVEID